MDGTTREGRGAALTFFTFIANVYLAAFGADAALSVIDELLQAYAGTSPISVLRDLVALSVVAASLVMVFVITFVPHLPKIVFVPLIASVFWFALGAPPFAGTEGETQLFLSLCQLLLAGLAFLYVQTTARGWFLSAASLPRRKHVFVRIVAASFVTLALIPVALVAFGVAAVVSYTETQTKGYLQFTWSDVRVRETVLRKDTKTVHLVATAHIAEASFYKTLYSNIPANAVVLAEGLSDRKGLLGAVGAQDKAAQSLGLDTQEVFEALLGPAVSDAGGTTATEQQRKDATAPRTRPDVVRADLDVSDLSQTTVRCMREDLKLSQSTFEGLMQSEPTALQCTEADRKVYYDEILYTRNNKLLAEFDRRATKYDVFVVPWGALHMPDLELAFKKRGFRIERTRMLTLARYQTVAGRVLDGLAAYKLRGVANRPYQSGGR